MGELNALFPPPSQALFELAKNHLVQTIGLALLVRWLERRMPGRV